METFNTVAGKCLDLPGQNSREDFSEGTMNSSPKDRVANDILFIFETISRSSGALPVVRTSLRHRLFVLSAEVFQFLFHGFPCFPSLCVFLGPTPLD